MKSIRHAGTFLFISLLILNLLGLPAFAAHSPNVELTWITTNSNSAEVSLYSEALDLFSISDTNSEGENISRLIKLSGEEITSYDSILLEKDGFTIVSKNGKKGVLDQSGNIVIPLEYDSLWPAEDGLLTVSQNGKEGIIDYSGNILIPLEYDSIQILDDGLYYTRKDGQKLCVNRNNQTVFPVDYDYISPFSDGLAVVGLVDEQQQIRFGFIDKTSQLVIPIQYTRAYNFQDGLAHVSLGEDQFYINQTGDPISPSIYDYVSEFSDGVAWVGNGEVVETMFGYAITYMGKYGLIDEKGREIIPLDTYDYVMPFEDGLATVGKFTEDRASFLSGVIDKTGKAVIPLDHDCVGVWHNGLLEAQKDGVLYYYDRSGTPVITKPGYATGLHTYFQEGISILYRYDETGAAKAGFMNRQGDVFLEAVYDHAGIIADGAYGYVRQGNRLGIFRNPYAETEPESKPETDPEPEPSTSSQPQEPKEAEISWIQNIEFGTFSQVMKYFEESKTFLIYAPDLGDVDYYLVDLDGNILGSYQDYFDYGGDLLSAGTGGKYGAIDSSGNWVIPMEYDKWFYFSDGLALVEQDGKSYFINQQNETVFECTEYEWVQGFSGGLAKVFKDRKYGCIDKTGQLVIHPQYERLEFLGNHLISAHEEERPWQIIDFTGNVLFSQEADDFQPTGWDNIIAFCVGGKWGCMDLSGKVLIPPTYDTFTVKDDFAWVGIGEIIQAEPGHMGADRFVGEYELIDQNGEVIIPLGTYDDISSFNEDGLATVKVCLDGIQDELYTRYGAVNRDGEVIIPAVYELIGEWNNGMIWAYNHSESTYYCFNTKGEIVFTRPAYTSLPAKYYHNLSGGFRAADSYDDENRTAILYNIWGDVIWEMECDRFEFINEGKYCYVRQDGRIGIFPNPYADLEELPPPPPTLLQPSSWAAETVSSAVEAGLVPEKLQSSYTTPITRAEFCALAVSLYEKVTGTEITGRAHFDDTSDLNVEKLAGLGVINGIGDGTFAPHASLTREQAAAMLSRMAQSLGEPLPDEPPAFSDAQEIQSYAVQAVGQVSRAGIMNGIGDNQFLPGGEYTREQSILTMYRLFRLFDQD